MSEISEIKENLCDYCSYRGTNGVCHAYDDDEGLGGEALCDLTDEELYRRFYGF